LRALSLVGRPVFRLPSFHLPASLRSTVVTRFTATTDALTPASRARELFAQRAHPALAGLPDYCRLTSNHSVSNHLRVVRDSPGCDRSFLSLQASSVARRLAHSRRPNRVHRGCLPGQPVLRTGRSLPVALHVTLLERSYGSIPHGSSPHRNGLPPFCLPAFSGARARLSQPQTPTKQKLSF